MSTFDNNIRIIITNGDQDSTLALWVIKQNFTNAIHIIDPKTLYPKFKNKNLIIINVELPDEIIDELLINTESDIKNIIKNDSTKKNNYVVSTTIIETKLDGSSELKDQITYDKLFNTLL